MIPRERTARTNGTIAHGSRFARQKRLEGQTARGRRHQPQSEAVISGHGRVYRERRTDLAFSEDPNLRTPRLAELANSCSLDGHVLDGPKRRAMGRERTWPTTTPICPAHQQKTFVNDGTGHECLGTLETGYCCPRHPRAYTFDVGFSSVGTSGTAWAAAAGE